MRILDFSDSFESASEPTSVAFPASLVSNTPSGNLAATTQQAANNELQGDIDVINAKIGAANGIAQLDADGKVPQAQIPAIALVDVNVVADITARDALTVQEGDVAVVTDAGAGVSKTYIYNGSSWTELISDGSLAGHLSDTSGAHAASAISNTPSGNLAATEVQAALNELQTDIDGRIEKSTATTKGDILVATGSATIVRQAVGANNSVLVADSSQTNGIKWGPVPNPTFTAPKVTTYLSGSGTFTKTGSPLYLKVRLVGAGGGSSGSGISGTGGVGGNGGTSYFRVGASPDLLVATGGTGGATSGGSGAQAPGGTGSLGTGPTGITLTGGSGSCADYSGSTGTYMCGGAGGNSAFGGGGGANGQAGGAAGAANTGGGGGGAGSNAVNAVWGGAGGGAGGYVDAVILGSSSTSWEYSVGAAGAAGTAGTSGSAGAAGGSGCIEVTEYYQ